MLSKKMTFSLMSLITLLAFAFVVPSAVTAEFAITLSPQTSAADATLLTQMSVSQMAPKSKQRLVSPSELGLIRLCRLLLLLLLLLLTYLR